MKRNFTRPRGSGLAGLIIIFALLLAACSSATGGGTPAAGANPTSAVPVTGSTPTSGSGAVKVASDPKFGQILVNSSGMTLYTNTVDTPGNLRCVDPGCTNFWTPQIISGQPAASGDIMGTLGTVKRPDGSTQVTYNNQPLYTFYLDKQPGDVKGEGFVDLGGTWHVVKLGATPGSGATGQPAATQPAPAGGGGYQYP